MFRDNVRNLGLLPGCGGCGRIAQGDGISEGIANRRPGLIDGLCACVALGRAGGNGHAAVGGRLIFLVGGAQNSGIGEFLSASTGVDCSRKRHGFCLVGIDIPQVNRKLPGLAVKGSVDGIAVHGHAALIERDILRKCVAHDHIPQGDSGGVRVVDSNGIGQSVSHMGLGLINRLCRRHFRNPVLYSHAHVRGDNGVRIIRAQHSGILECLVIGAFVDSHLECNGFCSTRFHGAQLNS